MHLHLITAEDPLTLATRAAELIRFPQLTMPLLAALTPPEWTVTHTDEITHAVDTSQSCDVVGITAATPGAPRAYELAAAFRARGVRVVLGGPHATLLAREAAEHVDVVVVGEAEPSWARVLQDLARETRYPPGRQILEAVTGLEVETLPNGARIYRCPTPANLAGLPHARRDLIGNGGWNKWWATRGAIIATRGCPYNCDYCSIPWIYPRGRQMRFRPVAEVAAEAAAIPDKGLVLWDDNLGANQAYAKSLFRALKPLKKWWTSQTTLTSTEDEEFLRLAAESGCQALFIGLESINPDSLASVSKRHNHVADYRRLLERCHAHGIAIQAGLIFGLDEDRLDVFARTVDVLGGLGLDNATISLPVPYPGTPFYARMQAEGRLLDSDWRHYNGKTHVVFRPRHMTPDQLLAGFEWVKTQFYAPSHIARRLANSRTGLWWNVARNVGYSLAISSASRARARQHDPAAAVPAGEELLTVLS